jgi:hypothetical protein
VLLPEGAGQDAEDRVLNKFLEAGLEKTDRALDLFIKYSNRVQQAEQDM